MTEYKFALTVLDKALTTRRPHGDKATAAFCNWLIKLLPFFDIDGAGNIHVDLRRNVSRTLFVAHVDTVHRCGGKNRVVKTERKWSAQNEPLGADDGAGVALLMHMIKSGVPGYYIFTQGEERGGIGATYLATKRADLLAQFDRAIAFDRRSTYSVITHQGWGRCASDVFAEALSAQLNDLGMLYMPDDTGVYTDTAEFTSVIPECTNISVGYDMEHSERETLDMEHFMALCSCVLRVDWEALPTKRDPRQLDTRWGDMQYSYETEITDDFAVSDRVLNKVAMDDPLFAAAIEKAEAGTLKPLIDLIAASVSPEDPGLAAKLISKRKMTKRWIKDIRAEGHVLDLDVLLTCAFDDLGEYVQ